MGLGDGERRVFGDEDMGIGGLGLIFLCNSNTEKLSLESDTSEAT